jgi:hypothetical protein
MSTKVFKRLNDSSIKSTWAPVLESYGVNADSRPWLVDYCHYHAMFENAGSINEATVAPGLFYQQPGSISGIGNPLAPTTGANGSGDKFPSLLPVAIQVAAKTIGFDLVGVVPMDSPVGFLPYLDYVYQGGNLGTEFEPYLIKIAGFTTAEKATFAAGTEYTTDYDGAGALVALTLQFVGASRIDGDLIFKVVTSDSDVTLAQYLGATKVLNSVTLDSANVVSLVSALENHISGFTSTSTEAHTDFSGPFLSGNEYTQSMDRAAGEGSKFRQMGLKMFTKFVEAKTSQVSISATVEQIQDLNRVWNFDAISMLENVAVNELAQTINKEIVSKVKNLATTNATLANATEGYVANVNVQPGSGTFENVTTSQRKLVTKILESANLIYHRARFGAGTFAVVSAKVASAMADAAGYSIAPFNNDLGSTAGTLYPAGKVHGLTIYVDPNLAFNNNTVLIGRKGADEEPGLKFMPYIMAESLQTISEGTFSPKIGMKSRYALVEAGWHPQTQYVQFDIVNGAGATGVKHLTGEYVA